jgi:hypothetical protein
MHQDGLLPSGCIPERSRSRPSPRWTTEGASVCSTSSNLGAPDRSPLESATLYRSIHRVTVARGKDVAAREAVLAGARVLVAATAVALVVSAGAVGSGAARSTAKLPAPLVGAWTRFVTAADWARVGIATEPPAHFSMLVSADGSVVVAEATDVRFAPLSGSRLVISHAYGCGKKKGVYRWRVAAGRLTLTKLQDTCAYSVGLYAGVWKREKV